MTEMEYDQAFKNYYDEDESWFDMLDRELQRKSYE